MRIKALVSSTLALVAATAVTVGVLNFSDGDSATSQPKLTPLPPIDLASERLSADEAIAFWQKRVDKDPADYLSRLQLASTYLRRGGEQHNSADAFTANDEVDKVLFVVPKDEAALRLKANARAFVHDFANALKYGKKVLVVDPTDSTGHAIVGDAYFELGNLALAEREYERLANDLGSVPEIDARLARLRHAQGRDDEAVMHAERAATGALAGGYAAKDLAYYDLLEGELARGLGRFDEAGEEYAAALELEPEYGIAIESLGKVRAAQGRLDEAETFWKQSGAMIGEPDFHVLSALGDIELARGNEAAARDLWQQALDAVGALSEEGRIGFLRDESRFRAARGLDVNEALRLAEQDFTVRQDALAYDTLAWAQLAAGDAADAQVSIDKALASGVRDAGIWYHAAEIAAANGDRDRARDLVRSALDLNPQFDLYEAARARVLAEQLAE